MDTTKLPKWAQDHIRDLERQRDESVKALNEYVDSQTPAAFYYDDIVGTEEGVGPSWKRVYVQTRQITVEYAGIELSIRIKDDEIDLQWNRIKRHLDYVAFVPKSFQSAVLSIGEHIDKPAE
jgi:hypothetical protein